jgi:hypothetical protein
MHQPGYVQGGQEVGRNYLLLRIHVRRIRGIDIHTENPKILKRHNGVLHILVVHNNNKLSTIILIQVKLTVFNIIQQKICRKLGNTRKSTDYLKF